MAPITIRHWQTRYLSETKLPAEQLHNWEQALLQLELGDNPGELADEEWVLIRTLHCQTRWPAEASAIKAGEAWRTALLRELYQVLADRDPDNTVYYRNQREAIADMLYRSAAGDTGRQWAWQQMGLLPATQHNADSIRQHAVQRLLDSTEQIWPILTRLLAAEASTGAFTQLLQHLPELEWHRILAQCPHTARYLRVIGHLGELAPIAEHLPLPPLAVQIREWALGHPWLAREQHTTLQILLAAALYRTDTVLAMAGPLILAGVLAQAQQLLGEAAANGVKQHHLLRASERRPGLKPAGIVDANNAETHTEPHAHPSAETASPESVAESGQNPRLTVVKATPPALPELASAVDNWLDSSYGGLLFLNHGLPASGLLSGLNTLAASGAPLSEVALRPCLWSLATEQFAIPSSDPVVRAFCGDWQPEASQLLADGRIALQPLQQTLVGNAAEWLRVWLNQLLPELQPNALAAVCYRPAQLRIEAGWIDMHLDLQQADTRLRRVALDLDPGWLPWLGCVVRFIYE